MDIREVFPFEHCRRCPEFVLKADTQTLYADDEIMTRQITVSCKNEWMCKQLERNITMEIRKGDRL